MVWKFYEPLFHGVSGYVPHSIRLTDMANSYSRSGMIRRALMMLCYWNVNVDVLGELGSARSRSAIGRHWGRSEDKSSHVRQSVCVIKALGRRWESLSNRRYEQMRSTATCKSSTILTAKMDLPETCPAGRRLQSFP